MCDHLPKSKEKIENSAYFYHQMMFSATLERNYLDHSAERTHWQQLVDHCQTLWVIAPR